MTTEIEQLLATGPDLARAEEIEAQTARFTERALAEGLVDVAWALMDAPFGPLTMATTDRGLVSIAFGGPDSILPDLSRKLSPRVLEAPARLDGVRRQLDEYFAGRRTEFELPLDWSLSAAFRLRVLKRLYDEVGYGRVVSYRQLAERVGSPGAARAVGTAMATNPIPLVVPCHRVLRTGGDLGGYGGGLDTKRWLLALEGATLT